MKKMKVASWHNIVDEVRYWDAMDLVRNLDDELENVRRGFASCVFCPGGEFPYSHKGAKGKHMTPVISETKEGIEILFPDLTGAKRENIEVEVEDRELIVTVRPVKQGEGEYISWFRLRLPEEMDLTTCKAEHRTKGLRVCLKRTTAKPAKRKIPLT